MNKANLRVTERYYADREYSSALKILNGRGIESAKKTAMDVNLGVGAGIRNQKVLDELNATEADRVAFRKAVQEVRNSLREYIYETFPEWNRESNRGKDIDFWDLPGKPFASKTTSNGSDEINVSIFIQKVIKNDYNILVTVNNIDKKDSVEGGSIIVEIFNTRTGDSCYRVTSMYEYDISDGDSEVEQGIEYAVASMLFGLVK